MCQRFDLKVDMVDMPYDTFRTVLDKLQGIDTVILTGWGEPLLYKQIFDAVKACKSRGMNVRFTTNGVLLNDERIEQLIDTGLDAITFSLDQIKVSDDPIGHQIKNQLDNIRKVKERAVAKGAPLKIYLQSVYQKGKEENLMDVVDFAIANKLDRVRLSRLDIRFRDYDRPTLADEKALVARIEKRLRNTGVGVDFIPHIAFDGLMKVAYKALWPLLHRFGKFCLRTYNDVYINEHAQVTPCCALPKLVMGDLLADDLKTIWNNDKFTRFRKHQKSFCGKCDVLSPRPHATV
jgi:MoaA/NifB/PqqE/SkfB family radical SAM enzyme